MPSRPHLLSPRRVSSWRPLGKPSVQPDRQVAVPSYQNHQDGDPCRGNRRRRRKSCPDKNGYWCVSAPVPTLLHHVAGVGDQPASPLLETALRSLNHRAGPLGANHVPISLPPLYRSRSPSPAAPSLSRALLRVLSLSLSFSLFLSPSVSCSLSRARALSLSRAHTLSCPVPTGVAGGFDVGMTQYE